MDPSHLETGAILAIVSTELLQWANGSAWFPWLTAETQAANRLVSSVIAFAVGLGIGVHFDPVSGTLTITGLLTSGIAHGFAQYAQQQIYYRLVVKSSEVKK